MKTRIRAIIAGLVLAAALAGGVAYATIPAADGTINGCYRTSGGANDDDGDGRKGQLRVVAAGEQCKNNELAIQWNAQGPKGDQGLQGAQGAQGEPGAAGTNGTNGVDGQDGQPGTNGTNGLDGAAGAPGESCLPTNPACVGPKGDMGPKGDPCPASEAACVGPAGPPGAPGGVAGYEIVFTVLTVAPGTTLSNVSAVCPTGKVVLGGGVVVPSGVHVLVSSPAVPSIFNGHKYSWVGRFENTNSTNAQVSLTATCALAGS